MAHSGALDPAASVLLLGAAETARQSGSDREVAESALSVDLRAVLGAQESVDAAWRHVSVRPLLVELAACCDRVRLARRFHDDLVARTQAVRQRPVVRLVRLAGHAAWPVVVDLDDDPPPALLARADGWAPPVR